MRALQPHVISTGQAAGRLVPTVTTATVIEMIKDERLRGHRGTQPTRQRWLVELNSDGRLTDAAGHVLPNQQAPPAPASEIEELRQRIERLERGREAPSPTGSDERYRDAALLLSATLEKQREALKLQTDASQILNEALAEQGQIISGLLLPDDVRIGRATPAAQPVPPPQRTSP